MQASKLSHILNVVSPVRGSLRLAPNNQFRANKPYACKYKLKQLRESIGKLHAYLSTALCIVSCLGLPAKLLALINVQCRPAASTGHYS